VSQENVDLLRRIVEDFFVGTSEADWEGWITRLPDAMDPAIEADASELEAPDIDGVYIGIEAVQQFWRAWFVAWETLTFEYELVDAGDRVVMLLDQRMRGRSTGIEVSLENYAQVATFRDGLMVHWKLYRSQSKALEAVALRE
jgi:hypothetical protein